MNILSYVSSGVSSAYRYVTGCGKDNSLDKLSKEAQDLLNEITSEGRSYLFFNTSTDKRQLCQDLGDKVELISEQIQGKNAVSQIESVQRAIRVLKECKNKLKKNNVSQQEHGKSAISRLNTSLKSIDKALNNKPQPIANLRKKKLVINQGLSSKASSVYSSYSPSKYEENKDERRSQIEIEESTQRKAKAHIKSDPLLSEYASIEGRLNDIQNRQESYNASSNKDREVEEELNQDVSGIGSTLQRVAHNLYSGVVDCNYELYKFTKNIVGRVSNTILSKEVGDQKISDLFDVITEKSLENLGVIEKDEFDTIDLSLSIREIKNIFDDIEDSLKIEKADEFLISEMRNLSSHLGVLAEAFSSNTLFDFYFDRLVEAVKNIITAGTRLSKNQKTSCLKFALYSKHIFIKYLEEKDPMLINRSEAKLCIQKLNGLIKHFKGEQISSKPRQDQYASAMKVDQQEEYDHSMEYASIDLEEMKPFLDPLESSIPLTFNSTEEGSIERLKTKLQKLRKSFSQRDLCKALHDIDYGCRYVFKGEVSAEDFLTLFFGYAETLKSNSQDRDKVIECLNLVVQIAQINCQVYQGQTRELAEKFVEYFKEQIQDVFYEEVGELQSENQKTLSPHINQQVSLVNQLIAEYHQLKSRGIESKFGSKEDEIKSAMQQLFSMADINQIDESEIIFHTTLNWVKNDLGNPSFDGLKAFLLKQCNEILETYKVYLDNGYRGSENLVEWFLGPLNDLVDFLEECVNQKESSLGSVYNFATGMLSSLANIVSQRGDLLGVGSEKTLKEIHGKASKLSDANVSGSIREHISAVSEGVTNLVSYIIPDAVKPKGETIKKMGLRIANSIGSPFAKKPEARVYTKFSHETEKMDIDEDIKLDRIEQFDLESFDTSNWGASQVDISNPPNIDEFVLKRTSDVISKDIDSRLMYHLSGDILQIKKLEGHNTEEWGLSSLFQETLDKMLKNTNVGRQFPSAVSLLQNKVIEGFEVSDVVANAARECVEKNKNITEEFVNKTLNTIRGQLLKGQLFNLYGGYIGIAGGHATMMTFKDVNGRIEISYANSGSGINYHESTVLGAKVIYHPAKTYVVPKSWLQSEEAFRFIKTQMECMYIPRQDSRLSHGHNMNEAYQLFEAYVGGYPDARLSLSDNNDMLSTFITDQRSGTCSWKCSLAMLRDQLIKECGPNEGIKFFKLFVANIKVEGIKKFYNHIVSFYSEDMFIKEGIHEKNLREEFSLAKKVLKKVADSVHRCDRVGFSQDELEPLISQLDIIKNGLMYIDSRRFEIEKASLKSIDFSELSDLKEVFSNKAVDLNPPEALQESSEALSLSVKTNKLIRNISVNYANLKNEIRAENKSKIHSELNRDLKSILSHFKKLNRLGEYGKTTQQFISLVKCLPRHDQLFKSMFTLNSYDSQQYANSILQEYMDSFNDIMETYYIAAVNETEDLNFNPEQMYGVIKLANHMQGLSHYQNNSSGIYYFVHRLQLNFSSDNASFGLQLTDVDMKNDLAAMSSITNPNMISYTNLSDSCRFNKKNKEFQIILKEVESNSKYHGLTEVKKVAKALENRHDLSAPLRKELKWLEYDYIFNSRLPVKTNNYSGEYRPTFDYSYDINESGNDEDSVKIIYKLKDVGIQELVEANPHMFRAEDGSQSYLMRDSFTCGYLDQFPIENPGLQDLLKFHIENGRPKIGDALIMKKPEDFGLALDINTFQELTELLSSHHFRVGEVVSFFSSRVELLKNRDWQVLFNYFLSEDSCLSKSIEHDPFSLQSLEKFSDDVIQEAIDLEDIELMSFFLSVKSLVASEKKAFIQEGIRFFNEIITDLLNYGKDSDIFYSNSKYFTDSSFAFNYFYNKHSIDLRRINSVPKSNLQHALMCYIKDNCDPLLTSSFKQPCAKVSAALYALYQEGAKITGSNNVKKIVQKVDVIDYLYLNAAQADISKSILDFENSTVSLDWDAHIKILEAQVPTFETLINDDAFWESATQTLTDSHLFTNKMNPESMKDPFFACLSAVFTLKEELSGVGVHSVMKPYRLKRDQVRRFVQKFQVELASRLGVGSSASSSLSTDEFIKIAHFLRTKQKMHFESPSVGFSVNSIIMEASNQWNHDQSLYRADKHSGLVKYTVNRGYIRNSYDEVSINKMEVNLAGAKSLLPSFILNHPTFIKTIGRNPDYQIRNKSDNCFEIAISVGDQSIKFKLTPGLNGDLTLERYINGEYQRYIPPSNFGKISKAKNCALTNLWLKNNSVAFLNSRGDKLTFLHRDSQDFSIAALYNGVITSIDHHRYEKGKHVKYALSPLKIEQKVLSKRPKKVEEYRAVGQLGKFFSRLEHPTYIHTLKHRTGELEVCLPRLNLNFIQKRVRSGDLAWMLKGYGSDDFFISNNQFVPDMHPNKDYLVIENAKGQKRLIMPKAEYTSPEGIASLSDNPIRSPKFGSSFVDFLEYNLSSEGEVIVESSEQAVYLAKIFLQHMQYKKASFFLSSQFIPITVQPEAVIEILDSISGYNNINEDMSQPAVSLRLLAAHHALNLRRKLKIESRSPIFNVSSYFDNQAFVKDLNQYCKTRGSIHSFTLGAHIESSLIDYFVKNNLKEKTSKNTESITLWSEMLQEDNQQQQYSYKIELPEDVNVSVRKFYVWNKFKKIDEKFRAADSRAPVFSIHGSRSIKDMNFSRPAVEDLFGLFKYSDSVSKGDLDTLKEMYRLQTLHLDNFNKGRVGKDKVDKETIYRRLRLLGAFIELKENRKNDLTRLKQLITGLMEKKEQSEINKILEQAYDAYAKSIDSENVPVSESAPKVKILHGQAKRGGLEYQMEADHGTTIDPQSMTMNSTEDSYVSRPVDYDDSISRAQRLVSMFYTQNAHGEFEPICWKLENENLSEKQQEHRNREIKAKQNNLEQTCQMFKVQFDAKRYKHDNLKKQKYEHVLQGIYKQAQTLNEELQTPKRVKLDGDYGKLREYVRYEISQQEKQIDALGRKIMFHFKGKKQIRKHISETFNLHIFDIQLLLATGKLDEVLTKDYLMNRSQIASVKAELITYTKLVRDINGTKRIFDNLNAVSKSHDPDAIHEAFKSIENELHGISRGLDHPVEQMPALQMIEQFCGFRLRNEQCEMIYNIIENRDRKSIHQLIMGAGKTSVIAVGVLFYLAYNEDDMIQALTLPDSLKKEIGEVLRSRMGAIYQMTITSENMAGALSDDIENAKIINNQVKDAIKNNKVMILSKTDLLSSLLMAIDSLFKGSLKSFYQIAETLNIFRKQGGFIIDEIDSVLDPSSLINRIGSRTKMQTMEKVETATSSYLYTKLLQTCSENGRQLDFHDTNSIGHSQVLTKQDYEYGLKQALSSSIVVGLDHADESISEAIDPKYLQPWWGRLSSNDKERIQLYIEHSSSEAMLPYEEKMEKVKGEYKEQIYDKLDLNHQNLFDKPVDMLSKEEILSLGNALDSIMKLTYLGANSIAEFLNNESDIRRVRINLSSIERVNDSESAVIRLLQQLAAELSLRDVSDQIESGSFLPSLEESEIYYRMNQAQKIDTQFYSCMHKYNHLRHIQNQSESQIDIEALREEIGQIQTNYGNIIQQKVQSSNLSQRRKQLILTNVDRLTEAQLIKSAQYLANFAEKEYSRFSRDSNFDLIKVEIEKKGKFQDFVAICRHQVSTLLPQTLFSNCLESYTTSSSPMVAYAVPAELGQEKVGSQFSSPIETFNYTMQLYLKKGVQKRDLESLLANMAAKESQIYRKNRADNKEKLVDYRDPIFFGVVKYLERLDPDLLSNIEQRNNFFRGLKENGQAIAQLVAKINSNPQSKMDFVNFGVAESIEYADVEMSANASDLIRMMKHSCGFSGTRSVNMSSQYETNYDAAIDAKTILEVSMNAVNLKEEVEAFSGVSSIDKLLAADDLDGIVPSAIIDVGGVLNGLDPQAIAMRALSSHPHFQEVFIHDEQGEFVAIDREGNRKLVKKSCVDKESRLTIFLQPYTVGVDTKQPDDAIARITLSSTTTWKDFAQGAWRMRGLDKGQRLSIACGPNTAGMIRAHLGIKESDPLQIQEIIKYTIDMDLEKSKMDVDQHILQELQAVAKKSVMDIFFSETFRNHFGTDVGMSAFKANRSCIFELLETFNKRVSRRLFDRYGKRRVREDAEKVCNEEINRLCSKLHKGIGQFSTDFRRDFIREKQNDSLEILREKAANMKSFFENYDNYESVDPVFVNEFRQFLHSINPLKLSKSELSRLKEIFEENILGFNGDRVSQQYLNVFIQELDLHLQYTNMRENDDWVDCVKKEMISMLNTKLENKLLNRFMFTSSSTIGQTTHVSQQQQQQQQQNQQQQQQQQQKKTYLTPQSEFGSKSLKDHYQVESFYKTESNKGDNLAYSKSSESYNSMFSDLQLTSTARLFNLLDQNKVQLSSSLFPEHQNMQQNFEDHFTSRHKLWKNVEFRLSKNKNNQIIGWNLRVISHVEAERIKFEFSNKERNPIQTQAINTFNIKNMRVNEILPSSSNHIEDDLKKNLLLLQMINGTIIETQTLKKFIRDDLRHTFYSRQSFEDLLDELNDSFWSDSNDYHILRTHYLNAYDEATKEY